MAVVVVAWGMGPPFSKLITAPPMVATFIRFGISSPVLFLLLAVRGRRITGRTLRTTALPGLLSGINLMFVFAALQEATIAVLSTIVAMQPVLMLLVAGPVFGERPRPRQLIFTLVGVGGAIIVILGAGDDVETSALGIVLATTAMAIFSIYFVLTRLARQDTDVDPVEWMTGINTWSFVATLVPVAIWMRSDDFREFGGVDWFYIVVVAFVTGVLGHVLMSWIHGYIETARSSLYILATHLVAVGLAWPIHDEPVTRLQVVGGAVVLAGVAMIVRSPPAPTTSPLLPTAR